MVYLNKYYFVYAVDYISFKIEKIKGLIIMDNEAIKKYIGKLCHLYATGAIGVNVETGKIIEVNGNWVEVETKKGMELINVQFIQCIKLDPNR